MLGEVTVCNVAFLAAQLSAKDQKCKPLREDSTLARCFAQGGHNNRLDKSPFGVLMQSEC